MSRLPLLLILSALVSRAQTFEEAWIRPAVDMGGHYAERPDGASVMIRNTPLKKMLADAFEVAASQIFGPGWIETERFDLNGKSPRGTGPEQMPIMIRNLLIERFAIAMHRVEKEIPGYALLPGRSGPQFKHFIASRQSGAVCRGCTMPRLIQMLERELGRPVSDETGFTGSFDLGRQPYSSLAQTVRDQLGFELKPRKAMVEVIVIDHIDRIPH